MSHNTTRTFNNKMNGEFWALLSLNFKWQKQKISKQDGPSSETSSHFHFFLRRPRPWVEPMTIRNYDPLTISPIVPWHPWHLKVFPLNRQDIFNVTQYHTALYSTVQYCTCYFSCWYTPLVEVNQAIYAWSFRQKFPGGGGGGGWHCNYSSRSRSHFVIDLEV